MNDVDVAIAVAEIGSGVVRRCFGTTLNRLDKGGGDFATNADVDAENAMVALLTRERPDDAISRRGNRTNGIEGTFADLVDDPSCGTLNWHA